MAKMQIIFYANGGEGIWQGGTIYNGDSFPTCEASGFSRSGYKFVEWNSSSDGSGESHLPGDTIPLIEWWYAIWIENTPKNETWVLVKESTLTAIADALRAALNFPSMRFSPSDFAAAVEEIEVPLTDLTGTTWYFNSTIDTSSTSYPGTVSGLGEIISLNYTYSGSSYTQLLTKENKDIGHDLYYGSSLKVYTGNNNVWVNSSYRTITITGGSAATNSNVIAWFKANATKQ